jgi:hypothetical protein
MSEPLRKPQSIRRCSFCYERFDDASLKHHQALRQADKCINAAQMHKAGWTVDAFGVWGKK